MDKKPNVFPKPETRQPVNNLSEADKIVNHFDELDYKVIANL